jgi:hypothetical protein
MAAAADKEVEAEALFAPILCRGVAGRHFLVTDGGTNLLKKSARRMASHLQFSSP